MRVEEKKIYITDDGTEFDSYREALDHYKKEFVDHKEFMAFLTGTDIWKDWEKDTDLTDMDIRAMYDAVEIVADRISNVFTRIYVAGSWVNVRDEIWSRLENKAVIEYFRNKTVLELSAEKILKLFACARENAEHRCFDGFVNQLDDYIEALEIVLIEE